MDLSTLVTEWRERAAYLKQFGDPDSARLWQLGAVELERAVQAHGNETLSLTEAAAVSGFTADHLGALIRRGKLRNAGRPNALASGAAALPRTNGNQR